MQKKSYLIILLFLVLISGTYFRNENLMDQGRLGISKEEITDTYFEEKDKTILEQKEEANEEASEKSNDQSKEELSGVTDMEPGVSDQETTIIDSPQKSQGNEILFPEKEITVSRSQDVKTVPRANKDFNAYVLEIIKSYDLKNKNYPYLLNNDFANYNGVTSNLIYQGQTLAKAHPSGNQASHCVGITFEVFFKAMQARNQDLGKAIDDFKGLDFSELQDLMLTWYVAQGPKNNNNLRAALEKYEMGQRINDLENVQPGDFIDFDRSNGTAHAVVFIGWIRGDKENIIGLKYWSSQESTKGIAYKEEYFGSVLKDSLYIARVY